MFRYNKKWNSWGHENCSAPPPPLNFGPLNKFSPLFNKNVYQLHSFKTGVKISRVSFPKMEI